MDKQIDVLKVLDRAADRLCDVQRPEGKADDDLSASIDEARAAVAELIEATEVEYAAQAAYDSASTGKQRNDTWGAVLDARKRRITAFLNVGGVAP